MNSGTGRRNRLGWGFLASGLVAIALLLALGIWQVQRLAWKTELIARVEAGLSADPAPAPGPDEWAGLSASSEYRRIEMTGHYAPGQDFLVQAVTARGSGFWVMSPFITSGGWHMFVNRGFVPSARRDPAARPRPEGEQHVSGLLRMSQPDGAFLRSNDPEGERWFSRDTEAMAAVLNFGPAAPYFLDADIETSGDGLPVGGLTVVSFPNNHLSYALTWFALAAGLSGLLYWLRRHGSEE